MANPILPSDAEIPSLVDQKPTRMDDAIAAAKAGDPAAREEILAWLRPKLRQWAEIELSKHLERAIDASSVTQDTLLSVHEKLDEFSRSTAGEFLSWARQALRNDVIDAVRKATAAKRSVLATNSLDMPRGEGDLRIDTIDATAESPSFRVRMDERAAALMKAVGELTSEQAEAIRLVHIENVALADAAQRMGKSKAALAKLLQRGMAVLREKLPQRIDRD